MSKTSKTPKPESKNAAKLKAANEARKAKAAEVPNTELPAGFDAQAILEAELAKGTLVVPTAEQAEAVAQQEAAVTQAPEWREEVTPEVEIEATGTVELEVPTAPLYANMSELEKAQAEMADLKAQLEAMQKPQTPLAKPAKAPKEAKPEPVLFEGYLRPVVGVKPKWSFGDFKNADFLARMLALGIPTGHPGVSWLTVGSCPKDCQTQARVSIEKTGLSAETLLNALPRSWRETEDVVAVPVYWFTKQAFPGGPKPEFCQTANTPVESYSAQLAREAQEAAAELAALEPQAVEA